MRTLKNNLVTGTKFWLSPFAKDSHGNVAIIFALTAIPVLVAVGVAIDYSRASDAQAAMQTAADSAILTAIIDTTTSTCASKQANASKAVKTVMDRHSFAYNNEDTVVTEDGRGCKITFSADVDTSIMNIIGVSTMKVSVTATAASTPGKKLEIALALDNTASMGDSGMTALKDSAKSFVDTLSSNVPSTQLKLGLVPFVAMVNPGKSYINTAAMSDFQGEADYHGYYLSGGFVHISSQCDYVGGGTLPKGSGGVKTQEIGNQGSLSVPKGKLGETSTKFAYVIQELLGVKAARAAELGGGTTTPTDYNAVTGTWVDYTFPNPNPITSKRSLDTYYPNVTVKLPPTSPPTDHDFTFGPNFASGSHIVCPLYNPLRINHFDLFNRTGVNGVPWKGCVMARKAPYDVDDSAPTNDANTKFVPFFWPSEPPVDQDGNYSNVIGNPTNKVFRNIYMPYPTAPVYLDIGLIPPDALASHSDIFKYNNTNNSLASFVTIENAVDTLGPNKGCPNAVTPLTDSTSTIKTQIDSLTRWNGGGTVTSEGLMWAWRVLSPNEPYKLGASYDDPSVQKYIVLMTDGANYLNETGPNIIGARVEADQTAYGSIWDGKTFAPQVVGIEKAYPALVNDKLSADALLNDRFVKACDNAKAKGVKVYTVYFRHDIPAKQSEIDADAKAVEILKNCANQVNYYVAADPAALKIAFEKIAKSILSGNVRLTK